MEEPVVSMNVQCDVGLLSDSEVTKRIVEVTIAARRGAERARRLPMNLALVIDRSGSMGGDKLAYVRQAACDVLQRLEPVDRVAVVAFDNQVRCVVPSTPVTPERVTEAMRGIQALEPGGSTALFAAWMQGAGEVAEHLDRRGVNRAILLTDGLANVGPSSPAELTHHADELRRRGVTTSTLGVGTDFDQTLLEALASHGGGQYQFIESVQQTHVVFQRELDDALTTVARDAILNVAAPPGVKVSVLGDLPHERKGRSLILPVGDLSAGRSVVLYLEVLTPMSSPGGRVAVQCEATFAGPDGERGLVEESAQFTYAPHAQAKSCRRDWDLRRRSVAVRAAAEESRALQKAREGDPAGAVRSLKAFVAHYRDRMDEARAAGLLELAKLIEHGALDAQANKLRHAQTYKARYSRQ